MFPCLQNELVFTDIIRLSLDGAVSDGPEGAEQPGIGKVSITLHAILCMHTECMQLQKNLTVITHAKYYTLIIT